MRIQKILLRFIFILSYLSLFNQTSGLSSTFRVDRVFSENQKFFCEIIEYPSMYGGSYGQTKVYDKGKQQLLYSLKSSFNIKDFYLSNNGLSICYIDDGKDSLYFYKNGIINKKYSIPEVLNCDNRIEDCNLYFTNPDLRIQNNPYYNELSESDKKNQGVRDSTIKNRKVYIYKKDADSTLILADKYPIFLYSDTLFIITPKLKVIAIDMNSGIYGKLDYKSNFNKIKSMANFKFEDHENFVYDFTLFPLVKDGSKIEDTLSKKFSFKFFHEIGRSIYDSLRFYELKFGGILDRDGKFNIVNLECDTLLKSFDIRKFIEGLKFQDLEMPSVVNGWLYHYLLLYRNPNDSIARLEKLQFDTLMEKKHEKDLVSDSIEGKYIPKDLDDCYHQLDKILSTKSLNEIDNLKSKSDMGKYHFGLGMWMRNNWQLWGGSRLSIYFNNIKIFHPDDMSGIILESYYCYRHKEKYDLEKKIKFYNDYWEKVKDKE